MAYVLVVVRGKNGQLKNARILAAERLHLIVHKDGCGTFIDEDGDHLGTDLEEISEHGTLTIALRAAREIIAAEVHGGQPMEV